MHIDLKNALTKQMEQDIAALLPLLQQNPTAINQSLICALQALKEIFVQLDPIEQTIELLQNAAPAKQIKSDCLNQAKAALTCLDFSRLIAVRLNCIDEDGITKTLNQLNR